MYTLLRALNFLIICSSNEEKTEHTMEEDMDNDTCHDNVQEEMIANMAMTVKTRR